MAFNHLLFVFSLVFLPLAVNSYGSSTGSYAYDPKPSFEKPKVEDPKPSFEKPKVEDMDLLTTMGVQGVVYCKLGPKLVPLQGAVARVTCLATDENGYESAPFSVLSDATDEKGYFFATLALSELENKCKLSECKAFLDSSPLETCNVPTDVNKGMSGALLVSHRLLADKKMKLYSVGPFFYTPEPESTTNNGY